MKDKQFRFSKSSLDKIFNSTSKRIHYFDSQQHGLCLRVTPSNVKTFKLHVWDKNRKKTVQETLGRYPTLSINDAREIVAERISDIFKNIDVAERTRQIREEQTLNEVFEIWLENHAKINLSRWDEEQRRYELYIKPHFGNKKISDITPDAIRRWRVKLSKQEKQRGKGLLTSSLISRALITFSSIFGKGAPEVFNPCSKIERPKPKKRTVFLKKSQLQKFFAALDHPTTPEYIRDYCLLSLYTGARQANVLAMRWAHIDLQLKLWIIPGEETKGKKGNQDDLVIPLLTQAVEILEKRKATRSSIFVLPSPRKSKTGHLVEPKRAWKNLLDRAGLPPSIRLHDLRRTMGSWQAITGSSTKIIGASLGHKSEQATAHYAHLILDPVRAAMQRAADEMDTAKSEEKIKKIK